MGCITSTATKPAPEVCAPEPIQINIIAASKTPSFASSISGEKQLSQTASNCASPSVVDGLTSVAMARSVSETTELAQQENKEQGTNQESPDVSRKQSA
ncbi:hypothetical protein AVEN_195291-1 [Araneus ventricosus]|uniref:Uncharacterized protein n=1 Tax=Araneus ventricosus TaxID=182803 RepID=A0A4Y2G100_ARAVE|nr:hypothetical protein AVEN_195291-1 [Araneus ventricosus]